LSPSHDVLPLAETGQVTQAVPQALMLVASTQMPLHGFLPSGHFPSHAVLSSTQESTHGFFPVGQRMLHLIPSHVELPPLTVGQGAQAAPQ
jgi:hypothetical protein